VNTAASEREQLLTLMRSALHALEQGDEASYRSQIETLTQWRNSPIFSAFDRLARELTRSLETLPIDARLGALAGQELPDARARLDFVLQTTEEATHRTLDLVDASRAAIDSLRDREPALADDPELMNVRHHLSEISLAQEYQDLTGQTIKRVVGIVHQVEQALAAIGVAIGKQVSEVDPLRAEGPAIRGVDKHGVSQNDADSLLTDLGL
jgi:chemotaxis protein CheZ